MLLRVDPKNVTYDLVAGVDVAMQPLPWCDPVEVTSLQDDGSYTLKLRVSDSSDTASKTDRVCAREKVYIDHTPSIAFRHLPPNSARFSYATEGALFISAQLSTDAVGALRKVRVLI